MGCRVSQNSRDIPEQGEEHKGRLQPAGGQEDETFHVVVSDARGPVERGGRVRQHWDSVYRRRHGLRWCWSWRGRGRREGEIRYQRGRGLEDEAFEAWSE